MQSHKYNFINIDAWKDDGGWYWNNGCKEFTVSIPDDVMDSNRKLLKFMRESLGVLTAERKGKIYVDRYDGSSVEFQIRSNFQPLYALQLIEEHAVHEDFFFTSRIDLEPSEELFDHYANL